MPAQKNMMRDRLIALVLLTVFVGTITVYLWWGRFEYFKGRYLLLTYLLVGGVLIINSAYFRDSARDLGLRLDNLRAALRHALPLHVLLLVVIAGSVLLLPNSGPDWRQLSAGYLIWAVAQQFFLQALIRQRLLTLFPRPLLATVLAAMLFALLHLPNPTLVLVTFLGGLLWCWMFQTFPNLATVSASHALLGILLAVFFKFNGLDQFHVGHRGIAFTSWGDGVQVAAGYDNRGLPIVVTIPGPDRDNRSLIRVFRPEGTKLYEWEAFPEFGYSGVIAVGDLGFDEGDEIVVAAGPGPGNPPVIALYSLDGKRLGRFQLPGFDGFGAWVSISAGKVLVTPGPGPDRGATVFEYRPSGELLRNWELGDIGFQNSARVMRLPNSNQLLLFGNVLSVNSSEIKVFSEDGTALETWPTIGSAFGLNLAPVQLDTHRHGLAAAPGAAPGHTPHIKLLDSQGTILREFFAYERPLPCGANISAVDIDGDSRDELVLGEGSCPDQPSTIRIVTAEGKLLESWDAY
ncbi:MAG: CPBP family intramembrane metalloprotease [Acidobacteriota bacterium]|nr:MAG: CPBP family intramembrane metalloprotease [Acidobacteriota bacterium]